MISIIAFVTSLSFANPILFLTPSAQSLLGDLKIQGIETADSLEHSDYTLTLTHTRSETSSLPCHALEVAWVDSLLKIQNKDGKTLKKFRKRSVVASPGCKETEEKLDAKLIDAEQKFAIQIAEWLEDQKDIRN